MEPRVIDRKRPASLSISTLMAERIDALLGAEPGQRSARYVEVLNDGMVRRYGQDWQQVADLLIEKRAGVRNGTS